MRWLIFIIWLISKNDITINAVLYIQIVIYNKQ